MTDPDQTHPFDQGGLVNEEESAAKDSFHSEVAHEVLHPPVSDNVIGAVVAAALGEDMSGMDNPDLQVLTTCYSPSYLLLTYCNASGFEPDEMSLHRVQVLAVKGSFQYPFCIIWYDAFNDISSHL